jgi:ribosomal protein S15P/S13E
MARTWRWGWVLLITLALATACSNKEELAKKQQLLTQEMSQSEEQLGILQNQIKDLGDQVEEMKRDMNANITHMENSLQNTQASMRQLTVAYARAREQGQKLFEPPKETPLWVKVLIAAVIILVILIAWKVRRNRLKEEEEFAEDLEYGTVDYDTLGPEEMESDGGGGEEDKKD